MNSAEKKVLRIAFSLFVVGLVVRVLPWGVPSIDQVDVPSRQEVFVPPPVPDSLVIPDSACVVNKVTKSDAEKPSVKSKKRKKKKKIVHFPIHINSATVDELCALKGVGPKLAEKILAFREAHGPFSGPSELEKVPGIGKKKAEGILSGVIFD